MSLSETGRYFFCVEAAIFPRSSIFKTSRSQNKKHLRWAMARLKIPHLVRAASLWKLQTFQTLSARRDEGLLHAVKLIIFHLFWVMAADMQLEERLGGLKRPQLNQTDETRDMFKLLFRENKRFCQREEILLWASFFPAVGLCRISISIFVHQVGLLLL